jgi:hypothetical protein
MAAISPSIIAPVGRCESHAGKMSRADCCLIKVEQVTMFFASHARQTDTVIAPMIAVNPPEASESWLYVRKYVDWV